MVMIFASEKARRFLLEKGEVYTFRLKQHKQGRDWITDKRCGKKICDVNIWLERKISSTVELAAYVEKSGFEHLWDWVAEAKHLNISIPQWKGYLYHVRRIKNETTKRNS